MLLVPGLSSFGFNFNNWGANPSASPGTQVAAGISNAEGSWVQLASAANIAQDIYWVSLTVFGLGLSTVDTSALMDIGVDPAGGTSYTEVVSNLIVGFTGTVANVQGARVYSFPLYIKAGSSVAARIKCAHTSVINARVLFKAWGLPDRQEALPVASLAETLGTVTNSQGNAFTPGNAADGTWASLGTTVHRLWWWQLGFQVSNAATTAERCFVDLAYGDASNKHIITRGMWAATTGEIGGPIVDANVAGPSLYCPVPAGANIYIRGRCENAPDTGYNGLAYGFGG